MIGGADVQAHLIQTGQRAVRRDDGRRGLALGAAAGGEAERLARRRAQDGVVRVVGDQVGAEVERDADGGGDVVDIEVDVHAAEAGDRLHFDPCGGEQRGIR